MGRPRKKQKEEETPRDVKTSVILSPRAHEILGILVDARFASSRSEAVEKIIIAWSESEKGKNSIADAKERIKSGWNPFK